MRSKRETLLSPKQETESAIYHCVSRAVDRDFKFGAAVKEEFVKCMRMYEALTNFLVPSALIGI